MTFIWLPSSKRTGDRVITNMCSGGEKVFTVSPRGFGNKDSSTTA